MFYGGYNGVALFVHETLLKKSFKNVCPPASSGLPSNLSDNRVLVMAMLRVSVVQYVVGHLEPFS